MSATDSVDKCTADGVTGLVSGGLAEMIAFGMAAGPLGGAIAGGLAVFAGLQCLTGAIGFKSQLKKREQQIQDQCQQLNNTEKHQKFIDDLIIKLVKAEEIEEEVKEELDSMITINQNMQKNLDDGKRQFMIDLAIFIIINIVVVSVMLLLKDFR